MTRGYPRRVLLAKVGLDGHDRAVRMLARELRDRGCEVVILGVGSTPERIAEAALQEDVELVGVSVLSGVHLTLVPLVVAALRTNGADIPVVCGGTIPAHDGAVLLEAGIAAVASIGTSITAAVDLMLAVADEHAEAGLHRSRRKRDVPEESRGP